MARKQFVSSKKNAPSRAVSSKEAALHGRTGDSTASDAARSDDDNASDSDSGSNSPGSPASSNGSSLFTSDEPDELDDDTSATAVAVEVVPASVGRGKQLRFPTVISRGKESRVFGDSNAAVHNDSSDNDSSDGDGDTNAGSDSDSLLSLASNDDDDDRSSFDAPDTLVPEADSPYPIKAARARKRLRPDAGYYQHMSTFVRDCLLSVRDGKAAADTDDTNDTNADDAMAVAAHDAFRRKLSAGGVERVVWKESPAGVDDAVAAASSSELDTKVSTTNKVDKPRKEHRTKEKRSESSNSSRRRDEAAAALSSSRAKDTVPAALVPTPDSAVSQRSSSDVKPTAEAAETESQTTSSSKPPTDPRRPPNETSDRRRSSSNVTAAAAAAQLNGDARKPTISSTNSSTNSGTNASTNASTNAATLCTSCKRKLSDVLEPEKPPSAAKKSVTIVEPASRLAATQPPALPPQPLLEPQGSFLIPPAATRDIARLRADASRLLEEARALKHEGNRRGAATSTESSGTNASSGTNTNTNTNTNAAAQIAQGKCYLRSGAKFFQHALKYADLKAAYKDAGDERHARTCGDYCNQTLAQTTLLIESTVRTMQSAGSKRMVALGCKLAAVLHLALYRLQHLKLFSLYSDLFTPGRSPDTRPTGTPPVPPGSTPTDSKEAVVRAHLLKEMEHTLRGFDMWRRYEACRVVVLPRISNPATTDLAVLFEELEQELGSS